MMLALDGDCTILGTSLIASKTNIRKLVGKNACEHGYCFCLNIVKCILIYSLHLTQNWSCHEKKSK